MARTTDLSPTVSTADIVTYYDQCEIDYKWLWHLKEENAMHYGYWTEDTPGLGVALQNMNKFVTDHLEIQPGDHILDAGCGVGGTAKYLIQNYDVKVHGITLSANQVQKAKDFVSKIEAKGKADFSVQDYCHTNFEDETFNKVYGIESICHASEKKDFLREAFRLLKPGGILVVGGFFATGKAKSPEDKKLMQAWADSWAVPSYEETNSFIEKGEQVGFKLESSKQINDNIMKSAKKLYRYFFPGIFFHTLFRLVGYRNGVQGKNTWSTYYQYKSLKKDLWEYRVIKLKKPIL
jgi:cyclopropane fatty-acyl-phospholipid synthase-like methyltransferase